ncbi:MAG: squalene synthase HpnC [Candidatus Binataceae bacterium]|nr:squalene synthase HpnC [Candidatus Binataceae bacterium]
MNAPAAGADSLELSQARAAGAPMALDQAYAFCAALANRHYENFTIASWLMPRQMRPHMHAIYAYARYADDFADEEKSLAKLDEWEHELDLAYAGRPQHPVFIALADTIQRYEIPDEPFRNLLRAFRSDVNFAGFETIEDLMGYARDSAVPVGRLVLCLFGYRDEQRGRLSDMVCSGLQLANFWQDVAIDFDKGRIYFPRADMRRFKLGAEAIGRQQVTGEFIELMRHEIAHARRLLCEGAALHRLVDRRLGRDVLMFAGGGLAILRAIEAVDYDVFHRRPRLSKWDYVKLGWRAWRGTLEV